MNDLISRKALIAEYDRVHIGAPGGARKLMEDAPAVDAVEVVHGEWRYGYAIDHTGKVVYHSIDCSVCDGVFKADNFATVEHWKERFEICPFCGAVMDKENEDGNL